MSNVTNHKQVSGTVFNTTEKHCLQDKTCKNNVMLLNDTMSLWWLNRVWTAWERDWEGFNPSSHYNLPDAFGTAPHWVVSLKINKIKFYERPSGTSKCKKIFQQPGIVPGPWWGSLQRSPKPPRWWGVGWLLSCSESFSAKVLYFKCFVSTRMLIYKSPKQNLEWDNNVQLSMNSLQ